MYCNVDDIKASIKSYSFFQQHNTPDDKELSVIGETVANEINGYLLLYGYTIPPVNENMLNFLSSLNVLGVIAQLIAKLVPPDARPDNIAEKRYEMGLKLLSDRHYIPMAKVPKKEINKQW